MKKWIVIILIIIIGAIGYNYIYQDHRNVSAELPEFVLTANEIKNEFSNNISASESKYLNKTIAITGQISDVDKSGFTLDSNVFCQLLDSLKTTIPEGSKIKIKGRVIGYDDLLEQVKLDQCIVIKY